MYRPPDEPVLLPLGLVAAIIGLTLFVDGLRICVMPMAEYLGDRLPRRMPLWITLTATFGLGILVTYAEPAIQSIKPLASVVDPEVEPYLFYVLNNQQEMLVLSIGLGVGAAAGKDRYILRIWDVVQKAYNCWMFCCTLCLLWPVECRWPTHLPTRTSYCVRRI